MNTNRLAAALAISDARSLYELLIRRYGERLTGPQFVRLLRRDRKRGARSALNLLLGQLAAREVTVAPALQSKAEAIVGTWAEQKHRRAA